MASTSAEHHGLEFHKQVSETDRYKSASQFNSKSIHWCCHQEMHLCTYVNCNCQQFLVLRSIRP